MTCDVTPHHLALSDELAGARRWAWEASGDPWADRAIVAPPYASSLRVNPPLRSPADAAACREALVDGTADAIATDHAPHTQVDKDVEFGLAANGISGIETALGVVLAAADAGLLTLGRAIEALTVGPARVLGSRIVDRRPAWSRARRRTSSCSTGRICGRGGRGTGVEGQELAACRPGAAGTGARDGGERSRRLRIRTGRRPTTSPRRPGRRGHGLAAPRTPSFARRATATGWSAGTGRSRLEESLQLRGTSGRRE